METRMHYAFQGKHLSLLAREAMVTDGGLELKGKGSLDTVNGKVQFRASLMKHLSLSDHDKPDLETLTAGIGLAIASSSTADPFITGRVKHVQSLSKSWNLSGTVKLQADVPATLATRNKDVARGSLRLTKRVLRFTDTQDLEVKAGADFEFTPKTRADVYFQLRENNWALKLKRGSWQVLYDL